MRIGVEEPVLEDHADADLQRVLRDRLAARAVRDGVEHLLARDVRERDHLARRRLVIDARKQSPCAGPRSSRRSVRRCRLPARSRAPALIARLNSSTSLTGEYKPASGIERATACASQYSKSMSRSIVEAMFGRCALTTTSCIAVVDAQLRAIDLADRCRRDRALVELGEHLRDRRAELLFELGPHLLERHRRHVVLQALEFLDDVGRDEVRSRRHDLTELHE